AVTAVGPAVAGGDVAGLGRGEVVATRGVGGDVPDLGGVQRHRRRPLAARGAGVDRRLEQHAVVGVVAEPQVDRSPGDGGLAPDRVAVDVERVRLVLDVLEPGEERGVEGGGGDLRDTAAVV